MTAGDEAKIKEGHLHEVVSPAVARRSDGIGKLLGVAELLLAAIALPTRELTEIAIHAAMLSSTSCAPPDENFQFLAGNMRVM